MATNDTKSYLVKIIMLGNGGVGKSSLTLQFMYEDFVEQYEPTKADSYRKTIPLDGHEVILDIMDTAGQEEYASVRDNYLRSGDCFLIVFSLVDRATFTNMHEIREQILRMKSDKPDIPIILIGNKSDLENHEVNEEEALDLAMQWRCKYIETSAKTRMNVDDAFYDVMRQVYSQKLNSETSQNPAKAKKKKLCCIL
jgi:small GTP-binding protein